MHELTLPDVYDVAARASINERCAHSYLHDVRGTMHALFSAVELLGRSAQGAGGNQERIHKACDLARRAITHHEKATLEALQALTFQHAGVVAVDLRPLVTDVVHFLRHEAAVKDVDVTVLGDGDVQISAERIKLQTLLVGLLTAAIDETPVGAQIRMSVDRRHDSAVISIDSDGGFGEIQRTLEAGGPPDSLLAKELTLLFARRFLAENGGRLDIDARALPHGALQVIYPLAA